MEAVAQPPINTPVMPLKQKNIATPAGPGQKLKQSKPNFQTPTFATTNSSTLHSPT